MNNQKPAPRPLHVEVAVGALIAGVSLVAGLLIAVWTEDWTPAAVGAIIAAGVLFVAACIPQIKAAVAEQNQADE